MEWISIKNRLPLEGEIVDLWDGKERHTDYKLILNYNEKKGNHFFEPTRGGVAVIRFGGSKYQTNATHWAIFTPPKFEQEDSA